jgi:hypothetical protein
MLLLFAEATFNTWAFGLQLTMLLLVLVILLLLLMLLGIITMLTLHCICAATNALATTAIWRRQVAARMLLVLLAATAIQQGAQSS